MPADTATGASTAPLPARRENRELLAAIVSARTKRGATESTRPKEPRPRASTSTCYPTKPPSPIGALPGSTTRGDGRKNITSRSQGTQTELSWPPAEKLITEAMTNPAVESHYMPGPRLTLDEDSPDARRLLKGLRRFWRSQGHNPSLNQGWVLRMTPVLSLEAAPEQPPKRRRAGEPGASSDLPPSSATHEVGDQTRDDPPIVATTSAEPPAPEDDREQKEETLLNPKSPSDMDFELVDSTRFDISRESEYDLLRDDEDEMQVEGEGKAEDH